MKRKICVITGSRADYGLLHWLMQDIKASSHLTLQIIATGMHLSPEYGLTYQEIEKDGFTIDKKIETLMSSDTSVGVAKSMGIGLIGFADALHTLQPDIMLVLGDRFEILSAVSAALVARIPVAHLHGGETTQGAYDEGIRHSITKMSHLHFVATEPYQKRVIQLGEHPEYVFLVGGLGIDNIKRLKLLSQSELEASLDIKLKKKNLLITFHPVTLESATAEKQMRELLSALEKLNDTQLIFTLPNADEGGYKITKLIELFASDHANSAVYTSLGQLRYLSCLQFVDGVVGNSSSGLMEVPSFLKGTINIGDRQLGRIKAKSIIDCEPEQNSILYALDKLYSVEFTKTLPNIHNPYDLGGASHKIVKALSSISLKNILKKSFYDL